MLLIGAGISLYIIVRLMTPESAFVCSKHYRFAGLRDAPDPPGDGLPRLGPSWACSSYEFALPGVIAEVSLIDRGLPVLRHPVVAGDVSGRAIAAAIPPNASGGIQPGMPAHRLAIAPR